MTLDPFTIVGMELRQPVPKGQARAEWLADKTVYVSVMAALRKHGYHGNSMAQAMFDLSGGTIRLPLDVTRESWRP